VRDSWVAVVDSWAGDEPDAAANAAAAEGSSEVLDSEGAR
jgi:hypothetical protein